MKRPTTKEEREARLERLRSDSGHRTASEQLSRTTKARGDASDAGVDRSGTARTTREVRRD